MKHCLHFTAFSDLLPPSCLIEIMAEKKKSERKKETVLAREAAGDTWVQQAGRLI